MEAVKICQHYTCRNPIPSTRRSNAIYCSINCANSATTIRHQLKNERSYRVHVTDTCVRCGFVAENMCQMDVHHLDGDHSNQDPANLATLCANCHRLAHRAGFELTVAA